MKQLRRFPVLPTILFSALVLAAPSNVLAARRNSRVKSKVSAEPATFSCNESESSLRERGVTSVRFGRRSLFIGYQQVSGNNKNPIAARFNRGVQVWCKTDYETSGDDGEGYGLLWNGRGLLYAVFSATGTQGEASNDYRRFTSSGWLTSYGAGGGPKVTVLAKLNARSGEPVAGTFVTAQLSNGRTNTLNATRLQYRRRKVVLSAQSFFSPRRPDRSTFTCQGASPFSSIFRFNGNLTTLQSSQAEGCS